MAAGPRARLIEHTIKTVQEHGVHAAALSELLKRSNTSRNSLYQHFPAGKAELIQVSSRIVSRLVYSHISTMADNLQTAPSAAQWVRELLAFWRAPLEATDYAAGSFMMAAALDELDPTLQSIAGQAFAEWTARLADGIVAAGIDRATAVSLAGFLLTTIEGTIVHSRALKSAHPFDQAVTQLSVLLNVHLSKR
ncbi:TetR/AcrR family transcriptional regulator [Nocardia camponoti]|uniref:Transcriptional regulator, TetR family protein n=1 Tax=Nocardia camponoti TaxID=1616106 RepID=A0A917QSI3_9NOCA|nr:TetR/AcrR family transcriptional regulator [Nocardia camponoti]GGK65266.1 putative transcriptional regulator, TetR family protein [Nocardia camponoti]